MDRGQPRLRPHGLNGGPWNARDTLPRHHHCPPRGGQPFLTESDNNMLLVIFALGVIATFIGFGMRDRNPGIVLLGLGFLAMLSAIVSKAIDIFG